MECPELNTASRRHIWANFLKVSSQKNEASEQELDQLAEVSLNRRQVKNVLKTTGLLAAQKETHLKFEHIDTVLSIERRKKA